MDRDFYGVHCFGDFLEFFDGRLAPSGIRTGYASTRSKTFLFDRIVAIGNKGGVIRIQT
jgi:hypothetical protein